MKLLIDDVIVRIAYSCLCVCVCLQWRASGRWRLLFEAKVPPSPSLGGRPIIIIPIIATLLVLTTFNIGVKKEITNRPNTDTFFLKLFFCFFRLSSPLLNKKKIVFISPRRIIGGVCCAVRTHGALFKVAVSNQQPLGGLNWL